MTWTCGEAWGRGCPLLPKFHDPCQWRTRKDIGPKKGCMLSFRRLRETAVRI